MKIRRRKADKGTGNPRAAEPSSLTMTRCTYCSEEVADGATRCVYCGVDLSLPLATNTVPRPKEHRGNFFDDTPKSFI
jgi:hypothetical protein